MSTSESQSGGAASERTRVRRLHELARYDRPTIDAILDAMPVCHVGCVRDGAPFVTPTLQWREGDAVYWHGSAASRMLTSVEGAEVCLTVSLLDGFVMARSGFNHSIAYRSVMLLGRARLLIDPEEKTARLKAFSDRHWPGRWEQLRPMSAKELKATAIATLAIAECSAKVSAGPPADDPEDYAHPVWAGVIPVETVLRPAVPDPRLAPGTPVPDHILDFRLDGRAATEQ